MIERVARAMVASDSGPEGSALFDIHWQEFSEGYRKNALVAIQALLEPTEPQWDGLARQIIFWMDMQPKTPRALFKHLERSGREIPQWLRDEPEMKNLDHVPSKGARVVLVYKAMLYAALNPSD